MIGQMPTGGGMGGGGGSPQVPPPQTAKERDSVALVLGQAFQGLGRELVAAAMGEQADPVMMSKFQKIILQVQDAMARATAAGAASRAPRNMEPQTGIAGQGNPALDAVRQYHQRG